MKLPEKVARDFRTLHTILKREGSDIRLVGGAVRDLMSGIEPKDYDFATTAKPERVMSLFNNQFAGYTAVGTGMKHGTVTVVMHGTPYEITTLRVDTETDGRHAKVEYTTDWEADAARRDFTVNAMYMDVDGKIYDYFTGRVDLMRNIVRFVGNPEDRIREDYLRILRYFRFVAKNRDQGELLMLVYDAIIKNAKGLEGISGERIWAELTKILSGPGRFSALTTMERAGVTKAIGLPINPEGMMYIQGAGNLSWISALAALVRDVKTLDACRTKWKFDTNSYNILKYVIENRREKTSVEWAKAQIALGIDPVLIYHLAQFVGDKVTVAFAKDVPPLPKFPINGNDVKEELGLSGRMIGTMLDTLKAAWIESNYTLDRDALIEKMHEIDRMKV